MTQETVSQICSDEIKTRRFIESQTEATWLGTFTSEDPQWHELRAGGIGGSEVGVICGLSPWASPYSLWATKTGLVENDFAENESMYWGKAAEPIIVNRFAEDHPSWQIYTNCGTWHSPNHKWQIANPDGIFVDENGELGILEIKTAMYEEEWDRATGKIPATYRAQVLWYAQTFGIKRAIVAVLFHGNKYEEYEIVIDEFEQQANLDRAITFQTLVETKTAPEFDGSNATYEIVRKIHPEIEDRDEEMGDLGIHYMNALAEADAATEKATELKSRVLSAMGFAKRGLINGDHFFTRTSKAGGTPYLTIKRGAK